MAFLEFQVFDYFLHLAVGAPFLYFFLSHYARVGFSTVKSVVSQNPVAACLFRPVGIMMLSQNLPGLIHQFKSWIGFELWFAFIVCHNILCVACYKHYGKKKIV